MDNGASSYRRFLSGDDEAFVEIIRDYKDGLMLYLTGITGNIEPADELMEDTFVKLVTKKPWYRGTSSFKTWLYAIGRNMIMDHMRKNSGVVGVPVEELAHLADEKAEERVQTGVIFNVFRGLEELAGRCSDEKEQPSDRKFDIQGEGVAEDSPGRGGICI